MHVREPLFVTAILLTTIVAPAMAATTQNLNILGIREDYFYNYDFLSRTASSTNVDWPVTMLFYNNADVNKVKNIFDGGIPGGYMYLKLNDGAGWVWDRDTGTGTKHVSSVYDDRWLHMRIYADSDDRMYNLNWGYYVLGTTHYDEAWSESWSGYSEDAEEEYADEASSSGYTVYEDWSYWYNPEPYRNESNHIWSNNGYTTAVNVP